MRNFTNVLDFGVVSRDFAQFLDFHGLGVDGGQLAVVLAYEDHPLRQRHKAIGVTARLKLLHPQEGLRREAVHPLFERGDQDEVLVLEGGDGQFGGEELTDELCLRRAILLCGSVGLIHVQSLLRHLDQDAAVFVVVTQYLRIE